MRTTALLVLGLSAVHAFTTSPSYNAVVPRRRNTRSTSSSTTVLFDSDNNNNNNKEDYSRELYLREEAESPFRKVRFFSYISLGAGALVSLLVSCTRVAAALAGINVDLLEPSATNAAIDLAGIVVLAFLYQRDVVAQQSRLQRASKGAALARLAVRMTTPDGNTVSTSLASLRRGRGIEKRVVIAAGSREKIASVISEATRLSDSLSANDLLVIPVVVPGGMPPPMESDTVLPECIGLPVGNDWKLVLDDEIGEAEKQGVDLSDGICIILKKNGRVGQRTKGIFLDRMVGEVEQRRELGLDVKNI